jgi:membrane-bound serine protease (ClpP class)
MSADSSASFSGRYRAWLTVVLIAMLCLFSPKLSLAWQGVSPKSQSSSDTVNSEFIVPVFEIDGAIGPALADYLVNGITKVNAQGTSPLIMILIDTPGGLSASLRQINQAILASAIPVACLVYPEGARAASAGTYLLYACHIAAMAEATTLGAATPVAIGGTMPGKDKTDSHNQAMENKILNDAIAYIRSLAQLRERNSEWAEAAVREAATLTANEALEQKVINYLAESPEQLLLMLENDGYPSPIVASKLGAAQLVIQEPNWRQQFLATITNPNIAYILMLIGVYGLLLEFYSPGIGIAGVTGALCLIVAMYAMQLLPVNFAGMALLALGIILLVAESLVPSFGIFGLGGIIAFVLGSLMLFDSRLPEFRLAIPVILAFALVSSGFLIGILGLLWRSRHSEVVSGQEAIIGCPVNITKDFTPVPASTQGEKPYQGVVILAGEQWQAYCEQPLSKGARASVSAIDGLRLILIAQEGDK